MFKKNHFSSINLRLESAILVHQINTFNFKAISCRKLLFLLVFNVKMYNFTSECSISCCLNPWWKKFFYLVFEQKCNQICMCWMGTWIKLWTCGFVNLAMKLDLTGLCNECNPVRWFCRNQVQAWSISLSLALKKTLKCFLWDYFGVDSKDYIRAKAKVIHIFSENKFPEKSMFKCILLFCLLPHSLLSMLSQWQLSLGVSVLSK